MRSHGRRAMGEHKMMASAAGLAVIAATALGAAGCGSSSGGSSTTGSKSGGAKIALVEVGPDPFSGAQTTAFTARAKQLGVQYKVYNAQGDATRMVDAIHAAMTAGYKGIVIQPASSTSAVAPITQANAAGICTVALTVPVGNDDTKVFQGMKGYVGWNGLDGGKFEGRALAKMMNGSGGIVIIQGTRENGAARLREDGARQVWKTENPGIKVLGMAQTGFDNVKVQSAMRDFITRFGDQIKGVLVITDPMAVAAAQVVNSSKIKGVPIMGFATQGQWVSAIAAGTINGASIIEEPGSEASAGLDLAKQCIEGNKKPVYINQIDLPSVAKYKGDNYTITKANASTFKSQW